MLQRLADAGLVNGKTVRVDATTLEANAALRSIVRRDTGDSIRTPDEARAGAGHADVLAAQVTNAASTSISRTWCAVFGSSS